MSEGFTELHAYPSTDGVELEAVVDGKAYYWTPSVDELDDLQTEISVAEDAVLDALPDQRVEDRRGFYE